MFSISPFSLSSSLLLFSLLLLSSPLFSSPYPSPPHLGHQMGVGASQCRESFPARAQLTAISSEEKVEGQDAYSAVLSSNFGVATSQQDVDAIEHIALPLCLRLMKNNLWTGNFTGFVGFVLHHLESSARADDSALSIDDVTRGSAGLFIIRVVVRHLVASLKGTGLVTQLEGDPDRARVACRVLVPAQEFSSVQSSRRDSESSVSSASFHTTRLLALLQQIITTRLTTQSLQLHLEAISLFLVLASSSLYHPQSHTQLVLVDHLITEERSAQRLFIGLHSILVDMRAADLEAEDDSIVKGIANILALPFQVMRRSDHAEQQAKASWAELETRTTLLILVLFHHQPNDGANFFAPVLCASEPKLTTQPRSTAWFLWKDTEEDDSGSKDAEPARLSFHLLADGIIRMVPRLSGSLLALVWLYHNAVFRSYVLDDAERLRQLVLHALSVLNNDTCFASDHGSALIALLLTLSSDERFATQLLTTLVGEDAPWHTERDLESASLLSLLISVMLRCLNQNWRVNKDQMIHQSILAILCNVAPHIQHLDLYVCQRLIRLLHSLVRQFFRQCTTANTTALEQHREELRETVKLLHCLLKIINIITISNTRANVDMMYTLLINKQDIIDLRRHNLFSPEVDNLHSAITFCEVKLTQARPPGSLSSSKLQRDLEMAIDQLPHELLKATRAHRYVYEEKNTATAQVLLSQRVWRAVVSEANLFQMDHGYPLLHELD
eukprot:m.134283 g.134283  ORF g.134283 m.134283 type:complete len:727 (+) comp15815_c0_seq5:78-2258(+)